MKFLAIFFLCAMPSVLSAQYQFPPVFEDYHGGTVLAKRTGKPLVTFVGCLPFEIQDAVVCQAQSLPGYPAQCVVVSKDGYQATLPMSARHAEVFATVMALKGVSRPADPFVQSKAAPSTADDSPWLSRAETDKIKSQWPANVPWGNNLRFYRLPPVYQNMYTMNNGRSRINEITPVFDVDPWRTSGGMHHIDSKEWRNVTGLDLPSNIEYWQEDTDVRAFALVPKWRWRFPKGTLAYDVLIRVKDGKEHIFEVRVQEKLEDGWDDGTTYRPKAAIDKAERNRWTWEFASHGLKGSAYTYTAKIHPKAEFAPAKTLVIDDGDFTPPNYAGAGMSCNACHSRVGEIYDVPGRIYRESRRGDDGRFSWHPFNDAGTIDKRWPIIEVK